MSLKFILKISILMLFFACGAENQQVSNPVSKPVTQNFIVLDLPKKTPFDSDSEKRVIYLQYYQYGYEWSFGKHIYCPPNSTIPGHEHVITGWIDGFTKGAELGGTSDFPAQYLKYLKVNFSKRLPN